MKIKFPLKMPSDAQVRTIEKLREHFALAQVLGYYEDGKLAEWLSDRDYKEEAEKVKALDSSSSDFKKSLCQILGVPYSENIDDNLDYAEIAAKNKRRERLKQFTADDDILAAVDMVAFSQEDLADLLDKDTKLIYLCGERFKIPCSKGMTYIGVNNPMVDIDTGYDKKKIVFKGVQGANIIKDNMRSIPTGSLESLGSLSYKVIKKTAKTMKKAVKKMKTNARIESNQAIIEDGNHHVMTQQSFRMTIEDVFLITGRGVVATGKIELGSIHTGDEVEIVAGNNVYTAVVLGIEIFRRNFDHAEAGANAGLLLSGVQENQIKKGQVIRKLENAKVQNKIEPPRDCASDAIQSASDMRFDFEDMRDILEGLLGGTKDKPNVVEHQSFRLIVESISEPFEGAFSVAGTIEKGFVQKADRVMITKKNGESWTVIVFSIITPLGTISYAKEGDAVELLLCGIKTEAISIGDLVTKN